MFNATIYPVKYAILITVLLQSACGGVFYTRYANGVPTQADESPEANGRLIAYRETPSPSSLRMTSVPLGSYVRFVVDKVCFAELPGLLKNQDAAWIGATLMADDSKEERTLLTAFEATLGNRQGAKELLASARTAPMQRVPTNDNACVIEGFRTPPVPLDGADSRQWPRMLFAAILLTSHRVQEFRQRATEFNEFVGNVGSDFGADLSRYTEMAQKVVDYGAQLIGLVKRDQVLLVATGKIPVQLGSEPGSLLIPDKAQRFVWLFTDEQVVNVKGKRGEPVACRRQQDIVTDAINSGQLRVIGESSVVADDSHACKNAKNAARYGAPYLIWHVEPVGNVSIGDEYWDLLQEAATHGALRETGAFNYKERIDRMREIVDGNGSLLSREHERFFTTMTAALEAALNALGVYGVGTGDICAALERLKTVVPQKELSGTWAAPQPSLTALNALMDAVQTAANKPNPPLTCNNKKAGHVLLQHGEETSRWEARGTRTASLTTRDHHCEKKCRGEPTRTGYTLTVKTSAGKRLSSARLRCVAGPCHGWNQTISVGVNASGREAVGRFDVWTRPTTWTLSAKEEEQVKEIKVITREAIELEYGDHFSLSIPLNAINPVLKGTLRDGTGFSLALGDSSSILRFKTKVPGPETIMFDYEVCPQGGCRNPL